MLGVSSYYGLNLQKVNHSGEDEVGSPWLEEADSCGRLYCVHQLAVRKEAQAPTLVGDRGFEDSYRSLVKVFLVERLEK
jgi:hypothetical protein